MRQQPRVAPFATPKHYQGLRKRAPPQRQLAHRLLFTSHGLFAEHAEGTDKEETQRTQAYTSPGKASAAKAEP